jgi:adenylate cyclase
LGNIVPREIERKFQVKVNAVKRLIAGLTGDSIVQGYLTRKGLPCRVRIVNQNKAFLTVKGPKSKKKPGRDEFEYEIPLEDGYQMLKHCKNRILRKARYAVPVGKHIWEIDVFQGDLEGLIIAEIELSSPKEPFQVPSWVKSEVSFIRGFGCKSLAVTKQIPTRKAA